MANFEKMTQNTTLSDVYNMSKAFCESNAGKLAYSEWKTQLDICFMVKHMIEMEARVKFLEGLLTERRIDMEFDPKEQRKNIPQEGTKVTGDVVEAVEPEDIKQPKTDIPEDGGETV